MLVAKSRSCTFSEARYCLLTICAVRRTLAAFQLNGSIPSAIGLLTALTTLYVFVSMLSVPFRVIGSHCSQESCLQRNDRTNSRDDWTIDGTQLLVRCRAIENLVSECKNNRYLYNNKLRGQIDSRDDWTTGDAQCLVRWRYHVEANLLHTRYLHSNQLTGPIPSTIGQIKALNFLFVVFDDSSVIRIHSSCFSRHLYDNQLVGPIPSSIGQLARLTSWCESAFAKPTSPIFSQYISVNCNGKTTRRTVW